MPALGEPTRLRTRLPRVGTDSAVGWPEADEDRKKFWGRARLVVRAYVTAYPLGYEATRKLVLGTGRGKHHGWLSRQRRVNGNLYIHASVRASGSE